jgi:transposase
LLVSFFAKYAYATAEQKISQLLPTEKRSCSIILSLYSTLSGDTPVENQSHALTPFQRKLLQKSLETCSRPEYRRRIEIMLMADAGYSQTQICAALECSHETARYWMMMAQSGNAHRWDDCQLGRPKVVNDCYRDRLKELVSHSPREYGYPFQRWTGHWLGKQLAKEFGITVSDRYINYLLKEMGLSTRGQARQATDRPQQAKITICDLPATQTTDLLLILSPVKTSS